MLPGLAVTGGVGATALASNIPTAILLTLATRKAMKVISDPKTLKLATLALNEEASIAARRSAAVRVVRLALEDEENDLPLESVLPEKAEGSESVNLGQESPAALSESIPENEYSGAIKSSSEAHGVPAGLLYAMADRESGFDPNAVGKAGEQGMLQLMPDTQKEVGVEDPFEASQNIDGGAKYIAKMIDRFGSTEYGLAAYNWGPGNMRKWLNKGNTDVEKLPKQVRSYVTEVMSDMQSYQ
jgi:soluble lytic murein transglycosylase-like protein